MPLDVSLVKALCCDVDGTLSDTDDLYAQQVSRLAAEYFAERCKCAEAHRLGAGRS